MYASQTEDAVKECHRGRFAGWLLERKLWVIVGPVLVVTLDRELEVEACL